MSRQARHRFTEESPRTLLSGTRAVITISLALTLVLAAAPAFAFWNSRGSGPGAAATGSLAPATNAAATLSGTTGVAVGWDSSAGSITAAGYYVVRAQGLSSTGACGSSATQLITSTGCTDTPAATGSYTYTVVAVFRSWTTTSAASQPVTFTAAQNMIPTITITNGTKYTSESSSPVISGTTSAAAGSTVTISVGSQNLSAVVQSTGAWSGSAASLANAIYPVTARVTNTAGTGSASQMLTVQTTPAALGLGTAASYSVLAGGLITSTGNSVLNGDVGTSPAGSLVGFPPATYTGSAHLNDSVSAAAAADLASAFTDATGRHVDAEITGDLNGRTFHAGVFHSAAAIAITGSVTLDAQGDPNAVFIFVGDAAFNTAAASNIVLTNGARASEVFWVASGAAGIGAGSTFAGDILAKGAVTIGAQSTVDGRALGQAAVTLSSNTLSRPE